MYCEKCGAVLDDNAAFCEKCGTQIQGIKPVSSQPNKNSAYEQQQDVYTIFNGEQATAYYKVLAIRIVVTVLSSIFLIIVAINTINAFDDLIDEIKYGAYDNNYYYNDYYHSTDYKNIASIESFKNIISFSIPICIISDIVSLAIIFVNFIVIKNTSLYLTNIGVVGNTGKPYGNAILKAQFSDIIHAEVKNCKNEYGWLIIDTKWGTKYTFILANPTSFLHYLNEERKNNS